MQKVNQNHDKKTRGNDRTGAERQRRFRARNKFKKIIEKQNINQLIDLNNMDFKENKTDILINVVKRAEIAVLVDELGRLSSLLLAFVQTLSKPDRERFRAQLEKMGVTETLAHL